MKKCEIKTEAKKNSESYRSLRTLLVSFLIVMSLSTGVTLAHCDTMDGPLIADAKRAIAENNVNYALKWVPAGDEKEIRDAFSLIMKVRNSSPEAKELGEKYFFDTLVRIHRTGEGMSFTGVKPSGTKICEKVLAADKSIAAGNLLPLNGLIAEEKLPELKKRFTKVMSLKNFDVNNVAEGREYVEAYVRFFKYAEGEESEEAGHAHSL